MARFELSFRESYITLTVYDVSQPECAPIIENPFSQMPFYDAYKRRLYVCLDVGTKEDARQLVDWFREELLNPDETIEHDWSAYLEQLLEEK